jgi:hypothetical protein
MHWRSESFRVICLLTLRKMMAFPAVQAGNITIISGLHEAVELVADFIRAWNDEIFIKRVTAIPDLTT